MTLYTESSEVCGQNQISAYDLYESLSYLETELIDYKNEWDEAKDAMTSDEWDDSNYSHYDDADSFAKDQMDDMDFFEELQAIEDDLLRLKLNGENLINEDHFEDYIKSLIKDVYIPSELQELMDSGSWPFSHLTFDYAAAAEQAKQDYMEFELGGDTFLATA